MVGGCTVVVGRIVVVEVVGPRQAEKLITTLTFFLPKSSQTIYFSSQSQSTYLPLSTWII